MSPNNKIENFVLDDGRFSFDFISNNFRNSPNFLGNINWEDLEAISPFPLITDEINEAINFYTASQVALESTVSDRDSPFADAINQIYQSILRREVDQSGLSLWVAQLNVGASLDSLRDALIASSETSSLVYPIIRLYEVAFGRQADDAGLTNWVNAFRNGSSLESIAHSFTRSQEFLNRFGASTDRSVFVENLYQNGLGRTSDAPGKSFWVDSTFTDEQLLLGFSEAAESIARLNDFSTIFLNNLSHGFSADTFESLTEVISRRSGTNTSAIELAAPIYLDIVALGIGGFKIIGETAVDVAGWSVSSAGDMNGDGFSDLIVGATRNDAGGYDSGAAYVVFGASSGHPLVNLDDIALGIGGFKIIGEEALDHAGVSVSAAGDVNGDGFDDVIVGASDNDASGSNAGENYGGSNDGAAYVVFGAASGITSVYLDDIALGTGGFKIIGESALDRAGRSVSAAGDINGDGFADLIVGAYGNDESGSYSGAAYVVFGAARGFNSVNLDDVALSSGGFKIVGETSNDQAGWSVSSAGDINGDGFDDLIVGARLNDEGGSNAGAAYVVFGTALEIHLINLDDVAFGTGGFKIIGESANNQAGWSVSSAGDINGDGFDDLIVGAYGNTTGRLNLGSAYVVYGTGLELATVNLDDVALGEGGFKIIGESERDRAGLSVSLAGDINNDGFDDLIVGADRNGAGAAYVVFGAASELTSLSLDDIAQGIGGFKIIGEVEYDGAGFSVSSGGDINNDGFDDLIIGAVFNAEGGTNAGAAYVVFGGNFAEAVNQLSTIGADNIPLDIGDNVALLGVALGDLNEGDVLI